MTWQGRQNRRNYITRDFITSMVGIIKQNRMLWAVFILQEEINE